MFRGGTTGQHRNAIGVSVRVPEGGYDVELPEVVVEPGSEAGLIVRVENRSAAAETLELTVEGVPAGWAEVHPRTVLVGPGAEREADVTVHVPRATDLKAAQWPLRVVAYARSRRVGSAPARIRVAPHPVLAVELRPSELRARRRARAEVRVANTGDAPADVELTSDHGQITPARVQVGPGEEAVARLDVSAPRRWLSRPEPVPLRVGVPGATAEGTFQQRTSLPKWALVVPMVVAAAVAWVVSRPHEVSVPRVTGLSVPEARERLREAGLQPRQAPLPAAEAQPSEAKAATGVVGQDPPAGTEVADGGDVTISYYMGEGVGTVTPKAQSSSVGPPPGEPEPIAYVRANRVLVTFPGEAEEPVGGTVGELSSDPAWDPRTGELAYVRRASHNADAEIVAVDPHAPAGQRQLTEGEGSYVSPAFAPDGGRLAVVQEDGSGYGGALCIVVPPALAPRCRADTEWRYGRPAWGPDGTLYALRRATSTTRAGGWDELVRVQADLTPVGEPVARGDLRSVAVARDGRFGVVARHPGEANYHVELLTPAGVPVATQIAGAPVCDVAWSGEELMAGYGACDGGGGEIVRLDPTNLNATGSKLFDGGEPALAG